MTTRSNPAEDSAVRDTNNRGPSPPAQRPVLRYVLTVLLTLWVAGGSLFYFYRVAQDFFGRHRDAVSGLFRR